MIALLGTIVLWAIAYVQKKHYYTIYMYVYVEVCILQ